MGEGGGRENVDAIELLNCILKCVQLQYLFLHTGKVQIKKADSFE